GRPLYAFRAVLGLRRSWLSREIVAFGLWAAIATGVVAAIALQALHPAAGSWLAAGANIGSSFGMRLALVLTGLLTVHCSAMVYRDTPRALWATRLTSAKFLFSGT